MTDERVRVELRRTGGFAGMVVESVLDTADLGPQAAGGLRADVASVMAAGSSVPEPAHMGRDLMRYQLTIDRSGRRDTVVFAEPHVPAAARPLLQRLVAAAGA